MRVWRARHCSRAGGRPEHGGRLSAPGNAYIAGVPTAVTISGGTCWFRGFLLYAETAAVGHAHHGCRLLLTAGRGAREQGAKACCWSTNDAAVSVNSTNLGAACSVRAPRVLRRAASSWVTPQGVNAGLAVTHASSVNRSALTLIWTPSVSYGERAHACEAEARPRLAAPLSADPRRPLAQAT
jgi:hypothetical protein